MTALVVADGLRKEYATAAAQRKIMALDGVSFTVAAGGALGVVGESGSGKTTAARIVAGLEAPSAGTVEVCGEPRLPGHVTRTDRRRRARQVQLVFQDPYASLDPRQRVRDAVEEMLREHRLQTPGRADELLDQVGLDPRQARALPRDLSGGQRQRVAIARALAIEPKLLVLDESVAALDVSVQAQVLNLLADLRDQLGIAYLFVSHDLAVIRQLCEECVVLHRGRIVEHGVTDDVLDHPQEAYTRRLVGAIPRPGWTPRRRTQEPV